MYRTRITHCGWNTSLLLALICSLLASPLGFANEPAEEDVPPIRHQNVLLYIPEGWHGGPTDWDPGFFSLERDTPYLSIHVYPAVPMAAEGLEATLAAWVDEELGWPNSTLQAYAPPTVTEHPGGGEKITVYLSRQAGDDPGRHWFVISIIDGGELAQVFMLESVDLEAGGSLVGTDGIHVTDTAIDGRALVEAHRPEFERFVSSARLTSQIVLATSPAGGKPLTLDTLYQVTDFLEWLLEVPFTDAQHQAIREHLIRTWQQGDEDEMEAVSEVLTARSEIDALAEDQREFVREAGRVELLSHLEAEAAKGDTTARLFLDVYQAAHEPLATGGSGEPPLTRQSSDALLEMLYFMANKLAGEHSLEVRPTEEELDAWAEALAADYAAMDLEKKQELAQMSLFWASLRFGWPLLSAEEQQELIEGWAQSPFLQETAERIAEERTTADERGIQQLVRDFTAHERLNLEGYYGLPLYRPYTSW